MMKDKKCVAGCKFYDGGEVKHHKDCEFYPNSLSMLYDIAEQEKIAFAIQVLTDLTEKIGGYSFKDVANKLQELKSLQDATKTN